VTRPDRSVVKYVINDILAYGREAHQLRTGVGAASLEQTHPVETQMKMTLLHKSKTGHDVDEWIILRALRKCKWFSGLHKLRSSVLVPGTVLWFSRQM